MTKYMPILALSILLCACTIEEEVIPEQAELTKLDTVSKEKFNDSIVEAAKINEVSAPKEDARVAYEKGLLYIFGDDKQQKNPEEGIKWLKIAAEQDYLPAQYILADLYLEGYPVLDNVLAIKYLRKAIKAGSAEAKMKLVKVLMKADQPKFDKAAFNWLTQIENNEEAQFLLAEFYRQGVGTEVNCQKAAEIYQQLADKNNSSAQCKLGTLYYFGEGVDKNLGKAKYYFTQAAVDENNKEAKDWLVILSKDAGKTDAEDELVHFYAQSQEPKELYQKAMDLLYAENQSDFKIKEGMDYLKQAAEKNHVLALRELGNICEKSLFGCEDMFEACDWYKQAAELGDVFSQFHLAQIYYLGIGVDKDLVASYAWANLAASQNDEGASALLGELLEAMSEQERLAGQEQYHAMKESLKQ